MRAKYATESLRSLLTKMAADTDTASEKTQTWGKSQWKPQDIFNALNEDVRKGKSAWTKYMAPLMVKKAAWEHADCWHGLCKGGVINLP